MSPRIEREAAMDDMADFAVAQADISPQILTTPALLAEVDALALRILRGQARARDVRLVQMMAERLRTAVAPPKLDGALWLDLQEVA